MIYDVLRTTRLLDAPAEFVTSDLSDRAGWEVTVDTGKRWLRSAAASAPVSSERNVGELAMVLSVLINSPPRLLHRYPS